MTTRFDDELEPELECDHCHEEFPASDILFLTETDGVLSSTRNKHFGQSVSICLSCLHFYKIIVSCNDCEKVFESKGIPIACPECDSFSLDAGTREFNSLIRAKQEREMKRIINKPLQTPAIIESMKKEAL